MIGVRESIWLVSNHPLLLSLETLSVRLRPRAPIIIKFQSEDPIQQLVQRVS